MVGEYDLLHLMGDTLRVHGLLLWWCFADNGDDHGGMMNDDDDVQTI